uniref:Putative ovule protein n=1 Tax=Solanum chacoense TaxID=4108 RepID=A0A0V0H9E6_SOLCH
MYIYLVYILAQCVKNIKMLFLIILDCDILFEHVKSCPTIALLLNEMYSPPSLHIPVTNSI